MSTEDTSQNQIQPSAVAQKEQEILEFWESQQIFKKSLDKKSPKGEFTFYDGPPFATGLPHFGHLLPGTIKDAIPRFKTMQGYHVRRQWGWDCHGLPIEKMVQEDHDLKTKQDIENFGIKKFNQAAKASVFKYDSEWQKLIPRTGRWVDMTNPYTTMDPHFTQSVWWGFGELYKKGLVYESFKVMHVSPLLETTLSNFEVNQAYKDITDISATVKFALTESPDTFVLAWTTTPWTLPANVALAVGADIMYVKVQKKHTPTPTPTPSNTDTASTAHDTNSPSDGPFYILAAELVTKVFKNEEVVIVEEFTGQELVGKTYTPVFDHYFKDTTIQHYVNGWKIYAADFVTTTDGTGVVHIAPAFGEDDLNLAKKVSLPFVQHVKMNGEIKSEVSELAGRQAKPKHDPQETDIEVIKLLAHKGALFAKEKYTHSYPHCWRTDAPLLNYATSSWFVKVTDIKESLVKNNATVTWVPEPVGSGRFGNWLKEAKDWAISRSRFWGTPIPIWKSEDGKQVRIIDSIEELKRKTVSSNTYYVMRHGEAEHNIKNIASDSNDTPSHLTENGKAQVAQAIKMLKDKKIDLIYVSPLIRTQETAHAIKEALSLKDSQIIVDDRIREAQTGFDGQSITEYRKFYATLQEKFEKKNGNGETLVELKKRVGDFMYDIEKNNENKTILIVSHEYPLWMLYALRDGLSQSETIAIKEHLEEFIETGEVRQFEFSRLPLDDAYELDFHRPYIDQVTFKEDGVLFTRIPDVFDTWIDSGAMPFASRQFPMDKSTFRPGNFFFKSKGFPADFIAEGIDQTRGWFYTLLVWSTALFGKAPYKHVVVNGTVLAEDGKKMSKSLKNYPPIETVIEVYGADALRYFLMNSPAVKGENINFSEKGVDEVTKKIVMRLDNVISFYEMYKGDGVKASHQSTHVLDRWILARLAQTNLLITTGFEKYELDKAARPLMDFVDDLSTWYLRRSRDRLKSEGDDKDTALATLRYALKEFAKLMAPIMPFKAEDTFLRTRDVQDEMSVHLSVWPSQSSIDQDVLVKMKQVRDIVTKALEMRSKEGVKVRQPIQTLESKIKISPEYAEIIKDEVNVKDIEYNAQLESDVWIDVTMTPELKMEGHARELIRVIQDLRKSSGLLQEDSIVMHISHEEEFAPIITAHVDLIKTVTRTHEIVRMTDLPTDTVSVNEHFVRIVIQKV